MEGERNRGGRGVAMAVDRDDDLIHGHVEFFGGGLDDADIGLMGHKPVDVIARKIVLFQCFFNDFCHVFNGVLEDFLALHDDVFIGVKEVTALAIGVEVGGDDSFFLIGGFEDDSARAIGEEDAGGAVGPVDNGGHFLGPDHQHAFAHAGLDESVGGGQCVDKAGADGLHIEGGAWSDSEGLLNLDCDGGEGQVGGGGGDDDAVNIRWL